MIVRGGTVLTPEGPLSADIAVEDGLIAAIGPGLGGDADVIDARGLTVVPGLIDTANNSHTLAAAGGTLFFETVLPAEFDARRRALEQSSVADFALWGAIVPGNSGSLADLAGCGAVGFEAFMADSGNPEFPRADDLTLYEAMRIAASLDLPVAVHAESNELVQELTRRAIAEGRTGIRDYLDSHPVLAEVAAIQQAVLLAGETGAKLHLMQVSSGRGVAIALEARARGVDLTIETGPHYLCFTDFDMERLGAVAKCAPPLRDASERKWLVRAMLRGDIDVVASGWSGLAGVQSTLAVLLDLAPLDRVVALTALNPARRFGIGGKGRLAPGCDADFTLVDLAAGAAIRRTVLRGQTIFADGKINEQARGKFVKSIYSSDV